MPSHLHRDQEQDLPGRERGRERVEGNAVTCTDSPR